PWTASSGRAMPAMRDRRGRPGQAMFPESRLGEAARRRQPCRDVTPAEHHAILQGKLRSSRGCEAAPAHTRESRKGDCRCIRPCPFIVTAWFASQPIDKELHMTAIRKTSGLMIATAAAALFTAGVVAPTPAAAVDSSVHCVGINACKGQG